MGLAASFIAANECQALQFIPLVILLQLFLSDIIRGIEAFPEVFQWISNVLPLTHANFSKKCTSEKPGFPAFLPQVLILFCVFLVFPVLLLPAARHQQRFG